jgi:hypothetical protein
VLSRWFEVSIAGKGMAMAGEGLFEAFIDLPGRE